MNKEKDGGVPGKNQNSADLGGETGGNKTGAAAGSAPMQQELVAGRRKVKGTGPRTESGKQRASRNALKQGIFSKAVVLKGESRAEYERFRAGLRKAREPQDEMEALLVDKLAMFTWRLRRVLVAESGEIRKNAEFIEWDQQNQRTSLDDTTALLIGNLLGRINDPDVLQECIRLLSDLKRGIETRGVSLQRDRVQLYLLYGDRNDFRLRHDLYHLYVAADLSAQLTEEDRAHIGSPSPEEYREKLLQDIEREICRLQQYGKDWASIETARTQAEVLCASIPDAEGLNRIMRYEASLERGFDRTLAQLERLQRMRLGQPVLPAIKLDI